MTNLKNFPRTLVLYPTRRGIAFALFNAPLSLSDWGTKRASGVTKDADAMHAAKKLIERYKPDVLVMEDMQGRGSRRVSRIRRLNGAIARHGVRQGIDIAAYSRTAIRDAFAVVGASQKHDINCAIVALIPALSAYQPRKRRAWDDESAAQGVFDAVSLGLTFFANTGRLDLAQTAYGEEETPFSVQCARMPYWVPSLPILELCS